ncbi:hypothetical protein V1515DRAFT_589641 [Lipomyces mesembrius]
MDGLRKLGLLGDKSGGIPSDYMNADEDTRVAVIARLIDSDSSYVKSQNIYHFQQMTEGHKLIVYDLKTLASNCGISVNGVHVAMITTGLAKGRPTPTYTVYLGKGSEKFQKHAPTSQEDESGTHLLLS